MVQQLPRDEISERAVLAGLLRHGGSVYNDVADILNSQCFTDQQHETIYIIFDYILKKSPNAKLDIATTLATAQELGLYASYFDTEYKLKYLRSLENLNIQSGNVRPQAQKLRKLLITRELRNKLKEADRALEDIGGTESIHKIIATVENPLYSMVDEIQKSEKSETIKIGDTIDLMFDNIEQNPNQSVGISTGFSEWDKVIGGGLRRGTVGVIGSRSKGGKTSILNNFALNICKQGIPILNLDTEMKWEDHDIKLSSNISNISINDIETGKFLQKQIDRQKIEQAKATIKNLPYYYTCIAGKPFEETISIMRRWVSRYVGVNKDGSTKPAVIFYDYLKLMSSNELNNLQEYQILGLQMTQLHNFAVQYDIPILTFVQLNRDGLSGEDTGIVAGSDRILWLCSHLTILKQKSGEELEMDKPELGDRKLVVLASRHGSGHEFGEYIHLASNLRYGRFREVGYKEKTQQGYINKMHRQPDEFGMDVAAIEF